MIISAMEKIKAGRGHRKWGWRKPQMLFLYFYFSFTWLRQVLVVACRILVKARGISFPDQGANPAPALGTWSLSLCTIMEVPQGLFSVE